MEVSQPTISPGGWADDPFFPSREVGVYRTEPFLAGWGLPDLFDAVWTDMADVGVRMTVEVVDRTPRVRSLALAAKRGHSVDGTILRRLPVSKMLDYAVAAAAQQETRPGYYRISAFKSPEEFREFRLAHPVSRPRQRWQLTPALLTEIAAVYRAGGARPVKAVADHWGKPRPTASRWVQKAKEEGYIVEANQ